MTRTVTFEGSFWGTDYCSSAGFDTLVKQLKEGRQMTKTFERYLKERAKIEEEYGKSLQRLVRNHSNPVGSTDMDTLKTAWESLKMETERIAGEHFEAAKAITDATVRLTDFLENQKSRRKNEESIVQKSIDRKRELHKKTVDSKKHYEKLCRENGSIELQVIAARNAGVQNKASREWDKLYTKQSKSKTDMNKADQQYRDNIDNLEQTRLQWHKEMSQLSKVFEQLEDDRIKYQQNEMWVHCNIMSQTYVDNDEHCEESRKTLERVNADHDITKFIKEKMTGTEKPAPIPYEPFNQGSMSATLSHRPPQPIPHMSQYD